AKHRAQVQAAKIRRKAAATSLVRERLASTRCNDCGEADPIVLEFDHVGPKRRNVGALVAEGASIRALEAEMAQCEVVCVNCHRRRTILQRGGYRLAPPKL